jgi:hypothetical protein
MKFPRLIENFIKTLSIRREEAVIICLELNLSLTDENIKKVEEIIKKRNFGELSSLKQN